MKKTVIAMAVSGLVLGGCGGGSSGSSSSDSATSVVTGFVLPTEISAVPTNTSDSASGVVVTSFMSSIQALAAGVAVADLPETSDYKKTKTKKYIEERALEQFDIIEQVMNALSQTHYAEAENVGADPYTAMVAWVDERDGREIKTLQPWVVQSSMIEENGVDVNRAVAWIEEPDPGNPGETMLIKAEFKIYSSATVNDDGSYADYGEWDLNVTFSDNAGDFFAASSRIDGGVNTIKINQAGGGPSDDPLQGVLVRSGSSGYGKVHYPVYDACYLPDAPNDCVEMRTSTYAYNSGYLALDPLNDDVNFVYKDRNPANAVEMTHRYGLFHVDASTGIAAGENVEKSKSFGFPVSYSIGNLQGHAYYGAWQGRHELWSQEQGSTLAGADVTRQDFGSNSPPVTYTVSPVFKGTLTRRTLVDGDLGDILNIPVETFINKHYDVSYDGTKWVFCDGWMDWSGPTCMGFDNQAKPMSDFTPHLGSLVVTEGDRKWVNIGRWDGSNNVQYVYLTSAGQTGVDFTGGPGFYPATFDQQTGQMTPDQDGVRYAPAPGDNMYIDVGGSIYIQYTADFDGAVDATNGTITDTGWIQKTLSSWDEQNFRPVFDPYGDTAFSPRRDGEYYIHNNGANFVVRRIDDTVDAAESYEVKIELQTAANPVNVGNILPTGTSYLATPWRPEVRYSLVTDSKDSDFFMKLVYLTEDQSTNEVEIGTVKTSGEWGLQAYNDSDQPLKADGTPVNVDDFGFPIDEDVRPVEFNWEYSEGGWGSQQFLIDGNDAYVMLSDPIALSPITVTNGAGQSKTLSLQFDGWMHGLPDMYHELAKNDFTMTPELADKVVNIPAGTEVTDGTTSYYVKPLEISVFLDVVNEDEITGGTVPDLTDAKNIDLADVPAFDDHEMGAKPADTVVKYSEGKPVE